MSSMNFSIAGSAGLSITITEMPDGTLKFDLANEGEQSADLRGLFFDVQDASILESLSAYGNDVSDTMFFDDRVTNLGGGVNMNGLGDFDGGISFGSAGIGKDDISSTSFILASSSGALDLSDFAGVNFGVRFTSVGEEDGQRNDSLKLGGYSPELYEEPLDPTYPGDPDFPPPDVVLL